MEVSWALLANAVIAGLLLGGFYAAMSVGISISFGMLDVVNIAHPAFIILGSYIAYIVNDRFGLDPIVVSVAVSPLFFLLGAALYRVYYYSFERRGQESLRGLAFFFGILFITEVALVLTFGVDYRMVSSRYGDVTWRARSVFRCAWSCPSSCPWSWSSVFNCFSRTPSSAARCSRSLRTRSPCA